MIDSSFFITLLSPEQIYLICLKVRDSGFEGVATNSEIFSRAEELGLEPCPAEVGLRQRLADLNQLLHDSYDIVMKPIFDRGFYLRHDEDGLWLGSGWNRAETQRHPDSKIVLRLVKFPK